jgi:hypothetical protein
MVYHLITANDFVKRKFQPVVVILACIPALRQED